MGAEMHEHGMMRFMRLVCDRGSGSVRRVLGSLLLALLVCCGPVAFAAADPTPAPPAAEMFGSGTTEDIRGSVGDITQQLWLVLSAVSRLPADLEQVVSRFTDPTQGPAEPWILQSVAALVLGLMAALLIPAPVERLCRRFVRSDGQGAQMVRSLIGDLCGIALVFAIFEATKAWWPGNGSARAALTVSFMGGLIDWRLLMLPVDVLLRHHQPRARLVDVGDAHAAEMHRLASWLLGFTAFYKAALRTLLRAGLPLPATQFLALAGGLIDAGLAFYLVNRLRRTVRATPATTAEKGGQASLLARYWYPLALLFVFARAIAWIAGVIAVKFEVYWALTGMGAVVLGGLILHSIVRVLLARSAAAGVEIDETSRIARWHGIIRHCVGVLLWLAAAVLIIEIWITPLAQVLPTTEWQALRRPVFTAAATIYIAYVLWQVISMHTETLHLPAPGNVQADEDGGGPPPIASRLQTMLPVLRIFVLVTIATVALLIALSELGVNTTSLIAGASIFGLAISFGSQSLVHDIVSGIFFMADDAFRIGEYIDTGKAKGTVENMSVRSLRLRHQNGQIHVIPFGQIQQVTNYSRDWTTVKFNLRLQLNTDIEKVRKTVKQIGAEMMKEPEFAAELLQPLKMQGVTEIDPQGLVVRLKFTARPNVPTLLQREALKRITKSFRQKGIEFANANMMIQTVTVPATAEDIPKPAEVPAGTPAGTAAAAVTTSAPVSAAPS
jgi:small-conductance mechanosensitive channel